MDELIESVVVRVTDPAQPAEARRAASALAHRLGFDETVTGRIAVVTTEAATNLVKHGGGGEIVLQAVPGQERRGLELLALDKGPGIANLGESLRDGVSSSGTNGTGLGAITRMADAYDIYSRPQQGTALLARFWCEPGAPPRPHRIAVGGISVPKLGERVCGDAWSVIRRPGGLRIMVADGLGHGPLAAAAARAATRVFRERSADGLASALQMTHDALRSTRGAAAAIADIDGERRTITYSGVGNIAGTVLAAAAHRSMVSHNGTLGHLMRTVTEFTYPWAAGAVMVLYSDGLVTHWSIDPYPGLATRDPSLVAGVLYRDFSRGRDDVTVVVARSEVAP